jgi:hypothetical protein
MTLQRTAHLEDAVGVQHSAITAQHNDKTHLLQLFLGDSSYNGKEHFIKYFQLFSIWEIKYKSKYKEVYQKNLVILSLELYYITS